jgi:hypothetical protein
LSHNPHNPGKPPSIPYSIKEAAEWITRGLGRARGDHGLDGAAGEPAPIPIASGAVAFEPGGLPPGLEDELARLPLVVDRPVAPGTIAGTA